MVITSRTMVRPWLVALLVLLTDRRTFGISRPSYATVPAHAESAPATAEDIDTTMNITEIATVRCNYKGRSYEPGSSVSTDQPCLRCTCVKGSLVCHLQVCPELPDPPPQGCVIVHKKNKCCAHLQCFYEQFAAVHSKLFSLKSETLSGPARMENSAIVMFDSLFKGCVVNGTIYAEGSAMDSSSLCEYCYCIKGRQQCVRPQCSMTIPGCSAVYKKHTCCPVKYNCSPLLNTLMKNTTDAPTTEMSLSARLKDCRLNGRLISLGEPVIGVARSSCETCFCINGQVRCDKVICPPIRAQISPNCGPVYSEGHCCPTSYNCTTAISNDTVHVNRTTTTTTTTETSTIMSSSTSSTTTAVDDDFIIPFGDSLSPSTTFMTPEESENVIYDDLKNATVDSTTMEDPMESRHANPAGLIHESFGGLNMTEKSNNFEMDYDEPTLPPSLPNLKIIPFVAADAVFDEPGAAYDNNYQPIVERVYNVSEVEEPTSLVLNSFSPPVETEGGFVPKDPPAGAVYITEKTRTTTERISTSVQPVTAVHHDDPVVAGHHRPIGSALCLSNGIKYKHGELLTDPSACDICVCIDAKIICQKNCPAVKVGCQRINDPNNNVCCGRIVCDEKQYAEREDIPTERVVIAPKPTETTSGTTAAVIEHIVYSAPPTERPMVATSPSPSSSTTRSVLTTAAPTSISRPVSTLAPTTHETPVIVSSTSVSYVERSTSTSVAKQPDNDEDYSFESMFSFLFGGDVPTNAPAETRIEHRTDDEIDDTEIGIQDVKPQHNTANIKQQHGIITDVKKQHGTADVKSHHNTANIKQHGTTDVKLSHDTVDMKQQLHGTVDVKSQHSSVYMNKSQHGIADVKPQHGTTTELMHKSSYSTVPPLLARQPMPKPFFRTPGSSQAGDANYDKDMDGGMNTRVQADFYAGAKTRLQNATTENAQDIRTDVKPVNNTDVRVQAADTKLRPQVKVHQGAARLPQTDAVSSAHRRPEHNTQQNVTVRPNIGAVTSKIKVESDLSPAVSALKISGCNIYGRMYRVGKIIAELSNPCLECMCTEIGVHCNQLKC